MTAKSTKISKKVQLDQMTHEEGLAWIRDLRERLKRKQAREKAYLDRRAARGTHTPTDEAYEQDQVLEDELIALLDQLEKNELGGQ